MNIQLFLQELDEAIKGMDNTDTKEVLEGLRDLILKTPACMLREQLIIIRDQLSMEG